MFPIGRFAREVQVLVTRDGARQAFAPRSESSPPAMHAIAASESTMEVARAVVVETAEIENVASVAAYDSGNQYMSIP